MFSSILGNPIWANEGRDAQSNFMWLLCVDISSHMEPAAFREHMEDLAAYCKSAALAQDFDRIQMPGEMNFDEIRKRREHGIVVDDETWRQICETAEAKGVRIELLG